MSKFTTHNFAGQKALIRVDFNVPLDANFNITDDTRMRATIPTIKKILSDGGMVILMSHLGRPKDGPTDKYSLKHLVKHLHELLNAPANGQQTTTNVFFADDCIGEQAKITSDMLRSGEVLLLENLRFYKEEEKAKDLGLPTECLFFIDPDRFQDGRDGPCHSREERKQFWTDVCKSLHLNIETITAEAKKYKEKIEKIDALCLEKGNIIKIKA